MLKNIQSGYVSRNAYPIFGQRKRLSHAYVREKITCIARRWNNHLSKRSGTENFCSRYDKWIWNGHIMNDIEQKIKFLIYRFYNSF